MNIKIHPDHYFERDYDTKERFISYWHQIDEVISLKPKNILEIGVGNGFVSDYLKKRKFSVTSLDIDPRLKPDIAGSVLSLPFSTNSFDVIACCEVLEHLSYENFKKALIEIYRVCINNVVLSLPDASRVYSINLQIPKKGAIKKLIPLPESLNKVHNFDGQHYWEIGKKEYPLRKIISDAQEVGFIIQKTYRIFEFPYHRFFVLKK